MSRCVRLCVCVCLWEGEREFVCPAEDLHPKRQHLSWRRSPPSPATLTLNLLDLVRISTSKGTISCMAEGRGCRSSSSQSPPSLELKTTSPSSRRGLKCRAMSSSQHVPLMRLTANLQWSEARASVKPAALAEHFHQTKPVQMFVCVCVCDGTPKRQ